jgi:phosphorylated adapter RNA export protein
VGRSIALSLFSRTQQIELEGGMMTKSGSRRRTPGGLYLQLLRDAAKEDQRIDEIKVRERGRMREKEREEERERKREGERERGRKRR